MATFSLHEKTIKIHASIANLDSLIEAGIKGAINYCDVFVPGQPEYETLVNELHDLAKVNGMELDPSEVPQEVIGYKYGVRFDDDGQLSYESRKRIAQFVINELDSAKIVVSVREEKTIGSSVSFTSNELTPLGGGDSIAKRLLRSINMERSFKSRGANLTCERVNAEIKAE